MSLPNTLPHHQLRILPQHLVLLSLEWIDVSEDFQRLITWLKNTHQSKEQSMTHICRFLFGRFATDPMHKTWRVFVKHATKPYPFTMPLSIVGMKSMVVNGSDFSDAQMHTIQLRLPVQLQKHVAMCRRLFQHFYPKLKPLDENLSLLDIFMVFRGEIYMSHDVIDFKCKIADDLAWEDVDSEYALTFFGKEALKICQHFENVAKVSFTLYGCLSSVSEQAIEYVQTLPDIKALLEKQVVTIDWNMQWPEDLAVDRIGRASGNLDLLEATGKSVSIDLDVPTDNAQMDLELLANSLPQWLKKTIRVDIAFDNYDFAQVFVKDSVTDQKKLESHRHWWKYVAPDCNYLVIRSYGGSAAVWPSILNYMERVALPALVDCRGGILSCIDIDCPDNPNCRLFRANSHDDVASCRQPLLSFLKALAVMCQSKYHHRITLKLCVTSPECTSWIPDIMDILVVNPNYRLIDHLSQFIFECSYRTKQAFEDEIDQYPQGELRQMFASTSAYLKVRTALLYYAARNVWHLTESLEIPDVE